MNEKTHRLLVAAALLLVFGAQGCGDNPEKALKDGVILYKEGKTEDASALLIRGLLTAAAVKTFTAPFPECRGAVMARAVRKEVTVYYPGTLTVRAATPVHSLCRDPDSGAIALAGANRLWLVDKKGRPLSEHPLEGDGEVMACAWSENTVVFYRRDTVYRLDPAGGETRTMIPEQKFPPPFSKSPFTVTFSADDATLAVAVGIAGSYNLYGINLRASSSLFTRRSCSSSKILADRGTFYYITGSAGSWTLSSYSPDRNTRKDLRGFTSLLDIEIVPGGLIFESRDGVFISALERQDDIALPFPFKLAGRCDGFVAGEHGGRLYLVDVKLLHEKLKALKEEIPGFFEKDTSAEEGKHP
ncbi:MAG TPA: hypothetical protein ENN21_08145 [Spirochaetes bacterium]|nr:hypothetical protein [Spirochaetota bacterium]